MANLRHEVYVHDGTNWNLINPLLTLSDFGINVAASEINLLNGATSNIQDQIDTLTNTFDNYLPLAGGTMDNYAQIKMYSTASSNIQGRDYAAIIQTRSLTSAAFCPFLSTKTSSGSWTIGTANNENLQFIYGSDTNYNNEVDATNRWVLNPTHLSLNALNGSNVSKLAAEMYASVSGDNVGSGFTSYYNGTAKAKLYSSGEGGNLRLVAPNGNYIEQDLYDSTQWRMYAADANDVTGKSIRWYFKQARNLDSTLDFRGEIPSTDDLNTYFTPGYYSIGATTPTNAPNTSFTWAHMIVINASTDYTYSAGFCKQIYFKSGRVYQREYSGNPAAWGSWVSHAENVSGTVAIGHGGTGATTAAAARTNLGLGSFATRSSLAWNEITQSGADSIDEGTSDFTDNTELFSSYASNNGFADTNAKGKVYRRDAIKLYNYVKGKLTPAAIGAAASSHTHSTLSVIDRRSAAMTIQKDKTIEAFFTNNGTPNSNWWAGIHVSGWTGGYSSWEIVGPSHNADQRTTPLYVRTSNINSAWGSWRQIYDSSNKPSLSDLGAAAASHSHSTYVLKAGDTMTGNLTLPRIIVSQNSRTLTIGPQNSSFYHVYGDSETAPIALNMPIAMVGNKSVGTTSYPTSALYVTKTGGIYSVGTKQTYKMIDFIDNTSDTYGNGIAIGGGGQTIIGGGESATTAKGQAGTAGAETMWICNDGNIDFYSNCQSAWSSAQHAYFNTSGDFIIPRYYYGSYANLTGSGTAVHGYQYGWSGVAAFDTSGWLRTVLWYATLYNGSFASGSTTLSNAMGYKVLILVGAMNGGARSSVTVPTAVLTTSAINFQMTDETYWVTVGLTKASNNHDVTMSYVSKNGTSYVQWVGGLN